jgi:hypothetical protein
MEKQLNLLQKLIEFRKKVKSIKKDATNPFYKSKYSTLACVIDTIEEALNEAGIGYIQIPESGKLTTTIYNADDTTDIKSCSIELILEKPDMQKLGSALTYARRYGLTTILGLKEEDDDANSAANLNNHTEIIQKKSSNDDLGLCPECGKSLVARKSKTGKSFIGCSGYPNCNFIKN